MLVVETLVALVEASVSCRPTPVAHIWHFILQATGAGPGTSRSHVADVLAESAAASILQRLVCLPPGLQPEVLLTELSAWAQQGSVGGAGGWADERAATGFGLGRVVPLDALVALAAVVGSGSLDERARAAFWTLDRDGAGYLLLEQLLRLTHMLVAVAAAGRLLLGLPPLQADTTNSGAKWGQGPHDTTLTGGQGTTLGGGGPSVGGSSAAAPRAHPDALNSNAGLASGSRGGAVAAGGGGGGAAVGGAAGGGAMAAGAGRQPGPRLHDVSRGLLDEALVRAFQEYAVPDPTGLGPPRLTADRLAGVVEAAAAHITMAVVQRAVSTSLLLAPSQPSAPGRPLHAHSHTRHTRAPSAAHLPGVSGGGPLQTYSVGISPQYSRSGSMGQGPGAGPVLQPPQQMLQQHVQQQHMMMRVSAAAAPGFHSRTQSMDFNNAPPNAPLGQQSAFAVYAAALTQGAPSGSTPTPLSAAARTRTASGELPPSGPFARASAGGAAPPAWPSSAGVATPAASTGSYLGAGSAAGMGAAAGSAARASVVLEGPGPAPPAQQAPKGRAQARWSILGATVSVGGALMGALGWYMQPAASAAQQQAQQRQQQQVQQQEELLQLQQAQLHAQVQAARLAASGEAGSPPSSSHYGSLAARSRGVAAQATPGAGEVGWGAPGDAGSPYYSKDSASKDVEARDPAAGGTDRGQSTPQWPAPPAPPAGSSTGTPVSASPVQGLPPPYPQHTHSNRREGREVREIILDTVTELPDGVTPNASTSAAPRRLSTIATSTGTVAGDSGKGGSSPARAALARLSRAGAQSPSGSRGGAASAVGSMLGGFRARQGSGDMQAEVSFDAGGMAGSSARGGGRGGAGGGGGASQEGVGGGPSGVGGASELGAGGGAGGAGVLPPTVSGGRASTGLLGGRWRWRWPSAAGSPPSTPGDASSTLQQQQRQPAGQEQGQGPPDRHRRTASGAADNWVPYMHGEGDGGGDLQQYEPDSPRPSGALPAAHMPYNGAAFSLTADAASLGGGRPTPTLAPQLPGVGLLLSSPQHSPNGRQHSAFGHEPHSLEDMAMRAEDAAKAEAQAAATRGTAAAVVAGGAAAAGGGRDAAAGGASAGATGAGAAAGGPVLPPLQRTIKTSVQRAGIRLFLHCGVCLLSIIALLLLDAALVAWIYLDRKERLSLSLIIVAATNTGLVLLVLAISIIRSVMSSRAAAREAAAAQTGQSAASVGAGSGGGGVLELVVSGFIAPALRTIGVGRPEGGGAGGAGDLGGSGWGSRLRTVWTTIGRVAGFDTSADADNLGDGRDDPRVTPAQGHQAGHSVSYTERHSGSDIEHGNHRLHAAAGPGDLGGGIPLAHGGLPVTHSAPDGSIYVPASSYGGEAHVSAAQRSTLDGTVGRAIAMSMAEGEAVGGRQSASGTGMRSSAGGGTQARQRTRGQAVPGSYHARTSMARRVEAAYPTI